jgi:thioredoxin 1
MAKEFNDSNFQNEVLSSDKLTVVDFWAEWCGPCRAIGPVIEDLSKEYDGKVNVGKVNVDYNPQVSMNYGITSIPAILFIKNGQVVDKLVSYLQPRKFCKKMKLTYKTIKLRRTFTPFIEQGFFIVTYILLKRKGFLLPIVFDNNEPLPAIRKNQNCLL